MNVDIWQLATIASKWCSLLAMAGVTGGSFSLCLAQYLAFPKLSALSGYVLLSGVIGICSALLFFLAQIGAINQTGITGMFDGQMGLILAQSSIGYTIGLRILGFAVVIFNWFVFWQNRGTARAGHCYAKASFLLPVFAMALLGISFALSGHTSALSILARAAIILHVLTAVLWLGSLYPLLYLSSGAELTQVKQLMRVFGNAALFLVAVLLLGGIFLLTQLLQSFDELFVTDYGLIVLLKLAAVTVLLTFAGINKLLLVPLLTKHNSPRFLQASIRMEIGLGLCIFAITAWLTTAVGPVNL